MEKRFIERESRYPTRRKLVKLDSNGNPVGEQLIVSIIRDDEVEGVKRGREGTPICAEALNEMLENAEKALAKSEEAKATAKEANENFVNVVANVKIINNAAGVALANSQAAQYTAEATKSAVKRLEDRVADGGTTVRVNNVVSPDLYFNSDPQAQLDEHKERLDLHQEKLEKKVDTLLPRADLIDIVYPVGSIYMSTSNVNPAELFNVGDWAPWGGGRVPVGVGDNGQTNYVNALMQGGDENGVARHEHHVYESGVHAHTNNNAGTHQHGHGRVNINNGNDLNAITPWLGHYIARHRGHNETVYRVIAASSGTQTSRIANTSPDGGHGHTMTNNGGHTHNVRVAGNLNGNMPPFITCHMWKRIG